MRTRSLVLAVVIALGALALASVWSLAGDGRRTVAEHPVTVPEKPRTVAVSATMPAPSAHERRLSAMLEQGAMPTRPTMAEVLTDTECTPDGRMISRCRNEVQLADGRTMVLRHPHDMRAIPCLAPGERVLLVPTAA